MTLIISCNLQICVIFQPRKPSLLHIWKKQNTAAVSVEMGSSALRVQAVPQHSLEPKKDVSISSHISSETLIPWALMSLPSPSSLLSLARVSCPTSVMWMFLWLWPQTPVLGQPCQGLLGSKGRSQAYL